MEHGIYSEMLGAWERNRMRTKKIILHLHHLEHHLPALDWNFNLIFFSFHNLKKYEAKPQKKQPVKLALNFNPSNQKVRQTNHYTFKANLVYIVPDHPGLHRETLCKTKTKPQTNTHTYVHISNHSTAFISSYSL